MIQDFFQPEKQIRFNRVTNKLNLDANWEDDIVVGRYLLIETYVTLKSSKYSEIFNDIWLKKYVTAQIKKQWGANMSKFEGVQLPGGVSLRGDAISSEANEELQRLEEELRLTYELPIDFMTG